MNKVIIVHGYYGTPQSNWFPWLKQELDKLGVRVSIPSMPNAEKPDFVAWLAHLRKVSGDIDESTYFVGHSLGCPTILRYMESLDDSQHAGGALLVAGFAEPIHFSELDGFTVGPWNDENIKSAVKAVNKIALINSDDDPHVPIEMAERMRDRFDAELTVMHKASHIHGDAGFTEVPLILDKLKVLMEMQGSS